MNRRAAAVCGTWLALIACSKAPRAKHSVSHGRLPQGIVARVGPDDISIDTVGRIARAEGITVAAAREHALSDALFAADAKSVFRGRDLLPVLERSAYARSLLDGMKRDALALGPATDAEVATLTEQRWRELDRPEAARTTHAIALVEKPADDAAARAIAQRIFDAVRGTRSAAEFLRLAQGVPADAVKVQVQRLPAVTGDGRVFDPDNPGAGSDQMFDPDFAKAALKLAVGEISEPTKSRFGYHVIFCEERLPEHRVPLEERRALLYDEAIKHRAERAKEELLARLSAAQSFQVSRAVDDLTSRVQVKE
jgi:peptidyl-prolyl cis-trans isomerase C